MSEKTTDVRIDTAKLVHELDDVLTAHFDRIGKQHGLERLDWELDNFSPRLVIRGVADIHGEWVSADQCSEKRAAVQKWAEALGMSEVTPPIPGSVTFRSASTTNDSGYVPIPLEVCYVEDYTTWTAALGGRAPGGDSAQQA